jgi:hypothetical protein
MQTKSLLVLRFNDLSHPSDSNVVVIYIASRSVDWNTRRNKKPNMSMFKTFFESLTVINFVFPCHFSVLIAKRVAEKKAKTAAFKASHHKSS